MKRESFEKTFAPSDIFEEAVFKQGVGHRYAGELDVAQNEMLRLNAIEPFACECEV